MANNTLNADKIATNNNIWYGVAIFDYLNTSGIYVGYLTPFLLEIFKRVLQNIFFPLYAAATLVYLALGIRHLLLDRVPATGGFKKENIVRVAVNAFSALVVTAAVVTTLAFSAVVGVASTVLFAANLGVTGIYNFACAGYFLHRYIKKGQELQNPALSPEERTKLEEDRRIAGGKSIGYLVVGATIVMVGVAGALALLGGILPLAAIGVAAGVIGAAFCIYAIVKGSQERKRKAAEAESSLTGEAKPLLSSSYSTPDLLRKFGITKREQKQAEKSMSAPALVLADKRVQEEQRLLSEQDCLSDSDLPHSPAMTYKK